MMQRAAGLVAVTPGAKNVWWYPQPTWIVHWFAPAATAQGPWGFCGWNPMLVYGADPHKRKKQDYLIAQPAAERDGHPCQKPEAAWRWLVGRVTTETQMIIDPFMGSGTTLVVAKQLVDFVHRLAFQDRKALNSTLNLTLSLQLPRLRGVI